MDLLTVEAVAERLHVKPATVRQWLRIGKLHGVKVGRRWLMTDDELAASLGQAENTPRPEPVVAFDNDRPAGRLKMPRIIG